MTAKTATENGNLQPEIEK